jgi:hypothetical protein
MARRVRRETNAAGEHAFAGLGRLVGSWVELWARYGGTAAPEPAFALEARRGAADQVERQAGHGDHDAAGAASGT